MDAHAIAPRHDLLGFAWRILFAASAVLLCFLMLPFMELIVVVPVAIAAIYLGAHAAFGFGRFDLPRPAHVALVVALPAVLFACAEALFALASPGRQTLVDIWLWVRQLTGEWLSVPFWFGLAAMGVRVASDHGKPTPRPVALLGVQVFVVVAATGLGVAMLRSL